MSKLVGILLCTCFILGATSPNNAHAWFWQNEPLVTINDETFTEQDYRNWWQHWQEPELDVPASLDSFIDWQIMAQEGLKMQLDREPSYTRKIDTFLKVRALMIFKNDAVDSKVEISHDDLWSLYTQDYCPRLNIAVFFFKTEKATTAKADLLRQKKITLAELRTLPAKEGGPLFSETKWLRRPQINEDWLTAIEGQEVGYITPARSMGDYFIFLQLIDQKGPEEEDFSSLKTSIERKVRKQKSTALTIQLLEDLKKKYQVVIDEDFLASIDETPLDTQMADKPVITTNHENISGGALQTMISKERKFRKQYDFSNEDIVTLKKRVVENMLAQTLISWEAIARHYENQPPFKNTYDFYRKHRLTKEIEKRFIVPEAVLAEDEAQLFYEKNQNLYTYPEMVSFILVEGEEELIKRIHQDIVLGANFTEVIAKHFPSGLPVKQSTIGQLEPELKTAILTLNRGEVSTPFVMNNSGNLVKLVQHKSAIPIPFKKVQAEIKQKLAKEKYISSKQKFLAILKEKSTIKINNKKWVTLHNDLVRQNSAK